jgi:DNA-binding transcriptional regulator PaaX
MSFKQELLDFIYEAGVLLPRLETPYGYTKRIRQATYYGTVYRLQKQKLIEKKKIRGKSVFVLTDKAQRLYMKRPQMKPRTDGLGTIIIFDIPEQKRAARNKLRKYLLRNHFTLLQESVLISNYELMAELKELIRELGITQFVTLIHGKVANAIL